MTQHRSIRKDLTDSERAEIALGFSFRCTHCNNLYPLSKQRPYKGQKYQSWCSNCWNALVKNYLEAATLAEKALSCTAEKEGIDE